MLLGESLGERLIKMPAHLDEAHLSLSSHTGKWLRARSRSRALGLRLLDFWGYVRLDVGLELAGLGLVRLS